MDLSLSINLGGFVVLDSMEFDLKRGHKYFLFHLRGSNFQCDFFFSFLFFLQCRSFWALCFGYGWFLTALSPFHINFRWYICFVAFYFSFHLNLNQLMCPKS